jgi:hypothetical protein
VVLSLRIHEIRKNQVEHQDGDIHSVTAESKPPSLLSSWTMDILTISIGGPAEQ